MDVPHPAATRTTLAPATTAHADLRMMPNSFPCAPILELVPQDGPAPPPPRACSDRIERLSTSASETTASRTTAPSPTGRLGWARAVAVWRGNPIARLRSRPTGPKGSAPDGVRCEECLWRGLGNRTPPDRLGRCGCPESAATATARPPRVRSDTFRAPGENQINCLRALFVRRRLYWLRMTLSRGAGASRHRQAGGP